MKRVNQGISLFCLSFIILFSTPVLAADLLAPYTLESSQTLPGGVRNPRFMNILLSLDTKFSSTGEDEPLGHKLNKQITWNDIIEAKSEQIDKTLIEAVIQNPKYGIDAKGSPGKATGIVNSYVNIKVPVLAMGITDRFTLGVAVPIVSADVAVDTGFATSEDGKKFIDAICETSPEKCHEAAAKLNNATAEKLARLGYQPLSSRVYKGVGDVQLVGKNLWYTDSDQNIATKVAVTLPTGRTANPDLALDVPTGDGRWKTGLTLIYDRRLGEPSKWTMYAGYTLLWAHSTTKRLPKSDTDSLSSDKAELSRKLADQAIAGTTIDYTFADLALTLTTGYSVQYQAKSRYEGSAQDTTTRVRYGYLEDLEPSQVLHAAMLGAGFSTVNWYKEKKAPLPLQVNLMYSQPLAGRNAPKNRILAGEMVLFF